MSWLDHCTWTDGLRAVFGPDAPSPSGWRVVSLDAERNRATVVVDLGQLPASPPAKWAAKGAVTTHVTLGLDPHEPLRLEGGLGPDAVVDLELEPDPAGGLRFVLAGPDLRLSTRSQFVTVQAFSGEPAPAATGASS